MEKTTIPLTVPFLRRWKISTPSYTEESASVTVSSDAVRLQISLIIFKYVDTGI